MSRTAFLVVFLAIFAYAYSELVIRFPDGTTEREMRKWEKDLNKTLVELSANLSKIDPYTYDKFNFNFDNDMLRVKFEAEDVVVIGFSNFVANDLRISVFPPSMRINVHFNKVHLITPFYNFDAMAVFVPIYGSGNLNLLAKDVDLGGSGSAIIGTGGVTGVKKLKVKYNLKQSNLQISGLLHNEPMSQIVSTSTTECFPEFVNYYGERLGELFGGFLEPIINAALSKRSKFDINTYLKEINGKNTIKVGRNTLKYDIN